MSGVDGAPEISIFRLVDFPQLFPNIFFNLPKLNHSSDSPASFRADSMACLNAKITTTDMHKGGSPVARNVVNKMLKILRVIYVRLHIPFDRNTPLVLELFFKNLMRKSTGMSFAPGGLYVHVRFVNSSPFSRP